MLARSNSTSGTPRPRLNSFGMTTIIFTVTGRRSLQGSGMNIESDKHVQVTLPDHQVQQLLFYQFYNFCFPRL